MRRRINPHKYHHYGERRVKKRNRKRWKEEEESRPEAVEAEREELGVPQEVSTNMEEAIHLEEVIPEKRQKLGKKKAVKAPVTWTPGKGNASKTTNGTIRDRGGHASRP